MRALLGFFKRFRAGLITHVVVLLWPFAGYFFGIIEREGNVVGFALAFTVMGLMAFDFISIFIAAGITARARAKEKPVPNSRDFFLGFAVSGGLLFTFLMAVQLVMASFAGKYMTYTHGG